MPEYDLRISPSEFKSLSDIWISCVYFILCDKLVKIGMNSTYCGKCLSLYILNLRGQKIPIKKAKACVFHQGRYVLKDCEKVVSSFYV